MASGRRPGDFWPRSVGYVPPGAADSASEEPQPEEEDDLSAVEEIVNWIDGVMNEDDPIDFTPMRRPSALRRPAAAKAGAAPVAKSKAKAKARGRGRGRGRGGPSTPKAKAKAKSKAKAKAAARSRATEESAGAGGDDDGDGSVSEDPEPAVPHAAPPVMPAATGPGCSKCRFSRKGCAKCR